MAEASGLNELADREGFLVVYPNAAGDRHWNDGRDTTVGLDDVGFVTALVEHLTREHRLDTQRVYAVGISNGGMLVQRLACERSDRIAAFSSVIAALASGLRSQCRPSHLTPMLMINGVNDPLVPWAGGTVTQGRALGKGGVVVSVPDTAAFWARHNGCAPAPETTTLPDVDPGDHTRASRLQFRGCAPGTEVVLYRIEGAGHTWPGSPVAPRFPRLVGRMSRDLNAAEVVWQFFQRHALGGAPPAERSR
jgi:polyhydroxybutyrate depolymerase